MNKIKAAPRPVQAEQLKIGQFISELRKARNLTQQQFAEALHTSQSAVVRMERGQQNFSTDMLLKISGILNREIITLADQSVNLEIEGGRPLHGEISTNASKNGAVVLLCASLLNRGTTTLENVPKIEEVSRIIEALQSLGATVRWQGGTVSITPPAKLKLNKLDQKAATQTRSMLLFIGALIHWFPKFRFPHPGGCKLGARSVRPHLFALEKFGATIETDHDGYEIRAPKLRPNTVVLYEMGDTVTENALIAASRINGTSVIKYASANYMVQELCHFLQLVGVPIDGIGTHTLTVHGQPNLKKDVTYRLGEDPIESMLFLSLAATTNSSILIKRCPVDFLELELLKLEKMGLRFTRSKPYLSKNGWMQLADIRTQLSTLKALEEKIHPLTFPGINIDNLPFFVPIATQAQGTTLIHDWVYENRAIYYLELNKLGANVVLADPHRVIIEGPTKLRPAEVICPPALRPAAIVLLAMLAAPGRSVLRNVYSINRGYEDLALRLRGIGARVNLKRDL